jgi:hypothetical protein
MLQPIDGSLSDYAAVSKQAGQGVTDEAMLVVAQEMGYDPAVFGPAIQEWIARMGKSQQWQRYAPNSATDRRRHQNVAVAAHRAATDNEGVRPTGPGP